MNITRSRDPVLAGITVGALREQLAALPPDAELSFNGLRFRRLTHPAPRIVQLEFHEVVYRRLDGELVVMDCILL